MQFVHFQLYDDFSNIKRRIVQISYYYVNNPEGVWGLFINPLYDGGMSACKRPRVKSSYLVVSGVRLYITLLLFVYCFETLSDQIADVNKSNFMNVSKELAASAEAGEFTNPKAFFDFFKELFHAVTTMLTPLTHQNADIALQYCKV